MRLITDNDRIVAEAGDDYTGPMLWIEEPPGYVQGSFVLNGAAAVVPPEVPRWAGLLAIQRHALVEGRLVCLPDDDSGDSSLFAQVQVFRNAMPPGLARDRMDAALLNVHDWMLESLTVSEMVTALGLSASQRNALFVWANAQRGSV